MSEKIKNYLGVAIILALFMLAGAALWYVQGYNRNTEPASFRSFAVQGEGKAVGIPDVASFSFQVIVEGNKDISALLKQNTDKINSIISFVKSQGVDAKDVKTLDYSVQPRYQSFNCPQPLSYNPAGGTAAPTLMPCPPAQIAGYTVTQGVSVKIRKDNFGKIGDLLSGVVDKGANSVSQLSFQVDDPTTVQNQARAEAFSKAKAKAESLAEAGGFGLGRLISIQENNGGPIPYYSKYGLGGGGPPADNASLAPVPAPTIEPGSQEITVDVTLQYEIR